MKPIILLVGKSGTGKNFLVKSFQLNSIPSYTTRKQRNSEVNGVEHEFVSLDVWESKYSKQNNFIAFTFYNKNYYWATLEQIENSLYDVYIIDPHGIQVFLKKMNGLFIERDFSIVYLKASLFKRISNMLKRGDTIFNIIKRLYNDRIFNKFEKDKNIKKVIIKV